MTSLKDILQIEVGLDALRKHLKEVTEKKNRLNQRVSEFFSFFTRFFDEGKPYKNVRL